MLGSTAVGAGGLITYTPALNANGLDKFLYTVSDGRGGSATAAVSVRVLAVNDAPVVTAVATPGAGVAPLAVQFTATASDPDGDAITYAWDFGDGTSGAGAETSHTYSSAGAFNAEVVVTDGTTSSAAGQTVSVTPASGPSTFVVQTVAGTGAFGGAGAGGAAVSAQLADPRRVAVTPDGTLYIVDLTRIMRVDAAGTLTTLRTFSSADEGPSLAVGPDGALYYTEADVVGACTEGGLYGEVRVRRLTEDGSDPVAAAWTNTAAVGSCLPSARLAIDGAGEFYLGVGNYLVKLAAGSTDAAWQVPVMGNVYALAGAPAGGVYVGTYAGILLVEPDTSTWIVAGLGAHGSGGDGGPAVAALVAAVGGMAVQSDGSITFLEYDFTTGLPRVRAIAPDGTISTIGGGQAGFNGDGLPALTTAFAFADSADLAADGGGGFYVADVSNQRVRRLAPVTP